MLNYLILFFRAFRIKHQGPDEDWLDQELLQEGCKARSAVEKIHSCGIRGGRGRKAHEGRGSGAPTTPLKNRKARKRLTGSRLSEAWHKSLIEAIWVRSNERA
jgi:hypothetical protein